MAPFVLKFKGNKSFSPLGQISDAETLTRTWKVCTKVASHLEQGQRLENLSWRLWFLQIALVQSDNAKQKREFKKFSKGMSDKLDKDKGRSIHELQAPNFKRTDSTDKVRLRVEEMATHRENGTVPTSGSSRFGADGSNNYMKGMQYTFAVDPRVKPIATTTATSASNTNGAQGAEGGKSMMGKMRVRPMHPPPVPPGRFKAEPGKDGDMTMHGNAGNTASNGSRNEHAMDVSEDHSHAGVHDHGDTRMHEDSAIASSTADSAEHGEHANEQQDNDTYFDSEEGAGHHTPTPQHLLPSHHPSALPYPPTTANPQVLSNALSSSTGQFGSQSNYASSNSNSNTTNAGGVARPVQAHIVRFPTIFSSDFGPTSLLCALPVSGSGGAPAFSFEAPSPPDLGNGYQSFSALVPNAERSITTQGIYGPSGPPAGMGYQTGATHTTRMVNNGGSNAATFSAAGMNGIGVGMQHASTPFDFGVPRPTFEFPIEEILKSDMGDDELGSAGGALGENAAGASEITPWDANNVNMNLNLAAGVDGMFGLGGLGATGHWGVPPSEIHNPSGSAASANSTTPTSPTKRGFHGSVGATPVLSRQNSTPATVAYGTLVSPANAVGGNAGNKDGVSAGQMQTIQVNAKANNTSPASVHSNISNSMGAKGESAYDGSVASQTSPATPSTGGGSVAGSSGSNAGSVVPGNVGNTAPGGVKSECANCGATHTPLWRRGLNDELNCNACGLYCKLHKRARPKNLRTTHGDRAGNAWGNKAGEAELAGEPGTFQCHNCATTATPLWRKDDEGNTLCNACGLYLKLHGTRRPLSMKSDVIRKRSRHETEKRTSVSSIITVMTPTNNNPQNSRRNSPTPPPSAGSNSSGPEPFANPALGTNGVDSMGFSFGQNFSQDYSYNSDSDYMSGIGMGMGDDLTTFSSFGSYGVFNDSTTNNTSMNNPTGLASPTSPSEVQHIVETTIMAGVENGGGHIAPNAKRRRMTLDSNFSGSSVAHTTGGSNSAHSSPTGMAGKGSGNSPPYFSLDATLNGSNNGISGSTNNNAVDQNGAASPTRSLFASSPGQSLQTMSNVTYDYYGYPIHPPMAPLHPPSLMHPHSLTWGENQLQHTPTQSSMSQVHSMSRSPSHSRNASHSHSRSRSGSQHITMPLYLYDGGASSRVYEGANAATPTATGTNNPTDEEIFNSGFDLFEHSGADDSGRMHYGPAAL